MMHDTVICFLFVLIIGVSWGNMWPGDRDGKTRWRLVVYWSERISSNYTSRW